MQPATLNPPTLCERHGAGAGVAASNIVASRANPTGAKAPKEVVEELMAVYEEIVRQAGIRVPSPMTDLENNASASVG